MQTKHYVVINIAEFSDQIEAIKKLRGYINCIEEIAFLAIEEVFGQTWDNGQIKIKLDDSTGGGGYCHKSIKIGIKNRNIDREYPKNLWGGLFHETHHAFLNLLHDKRDGKVFNGGHKAEVFNYAFIATTYLKLKEKNKINAQVYEYFLSKLEKELAKCNFDNRASGEYEYESELPNDAMKIFQEYVTLFFSNTKNFAKFIFYIKSSDVIFSNSKDFWQDLDKAKKFIANSPIL